ncbi:hypothetical protein WAI453_013633 [Rhynchosporium graminicola]
MGFAVELMFLQMDGLCDGRTKYLHKDSSVLRSFVLTLEHLLDRTLNWSSISGLLSHFSLSVDALCVEVITRHAVMWPPSWPHHNKGKSNTDTFASDKGTTKKFSRLENWRKPFFLTERAQRPPSPSFCGVGGLREAPSILQLRVPIAPPQPPSNIVCTLSGCRESCAAFIQARS